MFDVMIITIMNKNNIILTIASYFLLVTLQMYIFFVTVGSKPSSFPPASVITGASTGSLSRDA
jgi:hypothetical protein